MASLQSIGQAVRVTLLCNKCHEECRAYAGLGLAVGGLIYSASLTTGSVADRELELRAEDLARYVSLDESHTPRLIGGAGRPPPIGGGGSP